jgi:murein DD-endopeptidase MepM/ murein hydrolase activator NlpD
VHRTLVILLLSSVTGCTQYQPVAWNGEGSWAQARASANARRAMPEDLQGFLAHSSQRPIAGEVAAGSDEGRHLVLPGETLSALAVRYGMPLATLAKINGIKPPFKVYAGQVLAIPPAAAVRPRPPAPAMAVAARPAPVVAPRPVRPAIVATDLPAPVETRASAAPAVEPAVSPPPSPPAVEAVEVVLTSLPPMTPAEVEATRKAALKAPPALSGDGFLWPVRGEIASAFGKKPNGARNDGINIRAPEGTPVLAAENGVVVYAGDEIPGYGRMLLVSHAHGFTTAYAHNRDLLVGVGDVVDRGQRIATVGTTGDVGAPQLHFELRDGKDPIDPVAHLENARTRVASTR